ncbi:MAG: hypothetical protein M0009_17790 [Deltaproteobacteria bacterium]|nr:hypothetical protein [Deltaproteobacteria bacterium]
MKRVVWGLVVLLLCWGTGFAEQYPIDPQKNCLFLGKPFNPAEKAVKVKLAMNTRYRVGLSGEAFLSNQTGAEADPLPGVVLFYATNEQDGFATLYRVLKPGETIRFTTPNEEDPNVFLLAFVMDYWEQSINTGKYVLTVDKE